MISLSSAYFVSLEVAKVKALEERKPVAGEDDSR